MQWVEIAELYCGAAILGSAVGSLTAFQVYRRLMARLRRKSSEEAARGDLEKRRDAYLSGRYDEVREHAGKPARVFDMWHIQPGKLARYNLDQQHDSE